MAWVSCLVRLVDNRVAEFSKRLDRNLRIVAHNDASLLLPPLCSAPLDHLTPARTRIDADIHHEHLEHVLQTRPEPDTPNR